MPQRVVRELHTLRSQSFRPFSWNAQIADTQETVRRVEVEILICDDGDGGERGSGGRLARCGEPVGPTTRVVAEARPGRRSSPERISVSDLGGQTVALVPDRRDDCLNCGPNSSRGRV